MILKILMKRPFRPGLPGLAAEPFQGADKPHGN